MPKSIELQVTDSMRFALNRAFADARDCLATDKMFVPFSILCTSDGYVTSDHPGDEADEIRNSVKALLAQELPQAYVFCYDGFVDVEAGRKNAVICELARRGDATADQLAQLYHINNNTVYYEGDFVFVGQTKTLYPMGTKPIVSGLVQMAREREAAAGNCFASETDGE